MDVQNAEDLLNSVKLYWPGYHNASTPVFLAMDILNCIDIVVLVSTLEFHLKKNFESFQRDRGMRKKHLFGK